ncbi:MAG: hypothetical protein VXX23_05590, partial [Actinomycetota bacterium]|nr:hypothetical protein [Actinomycetota bacterium]
TTKHVSESLCKDDPKWVSTSGKTCMDYSIEGSNCSDTGTGGKTAMDACLVACNNCPSHIKLERSEGHMLDRLPSPVADTIEPPYSSLLDDKEWKMGTPSDISRNPEIDHKLDEIEEKLDNLRKNSEKPFCTCDDVKSNLFAPYRCNKANLSDNFVWDGEFNYLPEGTKDSDVRHKIKCQNGYKFADSVKSLSGKTLVYNCTSQKWETKGSDRNDPFVPYTFPDGMIHCSKDGGDISRMRHVCIDKKCRVAKEGEQNSYPNQYDCEASCSSKYPDCNKAPGNLNLNYCNRCHDIHAGSIPGPDLMCMCSNGVPYDTVYSPQGFAKCPYISDSSQMKYTALTTRGSPDSPTTVPQGSPQTPQGSQQTPQGSQQTPQGSQQGAVSSPKPCSENWFKQIFYDEDDCIPVASKHTQNHISPTEITIVAILHVLAILFGFIIYNAGGNIAIYITLVLSLTTLYAIIRMT